MKKFYFSTLLLFVFISTPFAQWQRVETLPTWSFYGGGCIGAIGDDFAVFNYSAYQILITTDAGKTWATKNLPQGELLTDLSLVSNNIFFIATSGNGGTAGNFYKTTDGGNTWTSILSNPGLTSCGNYIKMFSETRGIAMGDGPFISLSPYVLSNKALFLKTTSGTEWQQTCVEDVGWSADAWRRLDFVDENNGYFYRSGISPEKLLKTTDAGASWTITTFSGLGWMVKFYDKDYGFVYEYVPNLQQHLIDRTTDGGLTWTKFYAEGMGRVENIEFVPGQPSNIWLAAANGLYFSADSGKTWTLKISGKFFDVFLPTVNTGWAYSPDGNLYYTNNGGLITNVAQEKNLPTSFRLFQNYPNPFNPETVIGYQLSVAGHVTLKIYDMLGREIATLVNEYQQAGIHNSQFSIRNYSLPSGTYFYRLTAGDFSSTQKMVLLK